METPVTTPSLEHIEITPGVCPGKPRVKGHRIKVEHIVIWHERMGMAPDEIVSEHPGLTLADVHAAHAYYWDHREQIDTDIREGRELADRQNISLTSTNPAILAHRQQVLGFDWLDDSDVNPLD